MSKGHHLSEIIDALTALSGKLVPECFIYEFLASFGISKSIISRLKGGSINMAKKPGCTLLKDKIYFEALRADLLKAATPAQALAAAKADAKIKASKPRFLIATDFKSLAAFDTKKGETEEFPIEELHEHYTFFLPLAGMEKTVFQAEAEADVKAAEHMAKLYDLIRADNPPKTKEDRHALNVFLTRLLFCYFAEDTGIFPGETLFTHAVDQYTQVDGSDLAHFLAELFLTLNTDSKTRAKTPKHLRDFPYVNGGLFNDTLARHSAIPKFFTKSRQKLIELGTKSWKEINPDIFGSMFQGVVDDEKRAELGMHYTSVPNIMKVIKPLFLDDLYEELAKAKGSETKLKKLLARLYKFRIFDPACGSGNFLIIAYKELRRFEMALFRALDAVGMKSLLSDVQGGFDAPGFRPAIEQQSLAFRQASLHMPGIHVSQFYGIELDDFAAEVAVLALWLAEHQMNLVFKAAFGNAPASLPLKDGAHIKCGNALRENWEKVCPKDDEHEIFVLGNPPYYGARKQSKQQKEDVVLVAGHIKHHKDLDYIGCFFLKAANFIAASPAKFAFVSTNSICQGEQVALLWPTVLNLGLEIFFAYQAFKWANNAKGNAGVTCVIIGLRKIVNKPKVLHARSISRIAFNISPYLVEAGNQIVCSRNSKPLSKLPPVRFGNMPNNGDALLMSSIEKQGLLRDCPDAKNFIRPTLGTAEFIDGVSRWCIWIKDADLSKAKKIAPIAARIAKVREARLQSCDDGANKLAARAHQFRDRTVGTTSSILIPGASSERREYIPIGWIDPKTIITNLAHVIYDAPLWVFAALSSRIHITWVRAVAGGLETRIRYSSAICYNNFPFPEISAAQKRELDTAAQQVLMERERHFPKTIAQLYDPDTMPANLLAAHHALDATVEKCYRAKPFTSDEERLEYLFALYEKMTAEENA
jgi:hypothetical protein